MKVVILAGGYGTRLSEYTKTIPKPMVKISNKPILIHIINWYLKHGFNDFYIALGYKGNVIRQYFKNKKIKNCRINLVDTGLNTMTGGRLKKLKKFLGEEDFFMTYGDGLANVDLKRLLKFHKKNKKLVTLTAVRPPARFGAIKINDKFVTYFKEKSKIDEGWINGGFFVINPKLLNYIKSSNTFFEREPLIKASNKKQLLAYKHEGIWQCMDTKRDKEILEKIFKKKRFI